MKHIILLLVLILSGSCSNFFDPEQLEEELLDIDTQFSDYSLEHGFKAAFLEYCAEEGVLLRPGNLPIIGKEAIKSHLGDGDDSGFSLSWEPHFARAALSGDLGYTYGTYAVKADSGIVLRGTYVSIWEKVDGSWKYLLDTGNEGLGE